MTSVVFSRDRAPQLDAFLRSWKYHVRPHSAMHVLYLSSVPRHEAAYREVFKQHPFVIPHEQRVFKADLLEMLPRAGLVTFYVDDMIFIRPWNINDAVSGLSLRLGLNLTHNYASGDTEQPKPFLTPKGCMLVWPWAEGQLAWAYPLSLDGHVFDITELRPMLDAASFRSPNTLESALQAYLPVFITREGRCYPRSRVVNVPWNRVQKDWHSRHGDQHDANALLELWEGGQRINVEPFYGVENTSVHQEFPLTLEAR